MGNSARAGASAAVVVQRFAYEQPHGRRHAVTLSPPPPPPLRPAVLSLSRGLSLSLHRRGCTRRGGGGGRRRDVQAEPAFCGPSALAVALNALGVDPGRTWKAPWRWWTEELLGCCKPLEEVRRAARRGALSIGVAAIARIRCVANVVARAECVPRTRSARDSSSVMGGGAARPSAAAAASCARTPQTSTVPERRGKPSHPSSPLPARRLTVPSLPPPAPPPSFPEFPRTLLSIIVGFSLYRCARKA